MTEKLTVNCEVVCDDKKEHRFLSKRIWDKTLPAVCVVTLNPSSCNPFETDLTTMLILNNVYRLGGIGGVYFVNLFSKVTTKLSSEGYSEEKTFYEKNFKCMADTAKICDKVIIAWGSAGKTNKKVQERESEVLDLLGQYPEKLFVIANETGNVGIHPLHPSVRAKWILQKHTNLQ